MSAIRRLKRRIVSSLAISEVIGWVSPKVQAPYVVRVGPRVNIAAKAEPGPYRSNLSAC